GRRRRRGRASTNADQLEELVTLRMSGIAVGLLGLAACGTIHNGTRQVVRFESNPPGATVHIRGQRVTTAFEQLMCPGFALIPYAMTPEEHTVVTPAELELPRRNAYELRFEKDGFEPVSSVIRRTGSPAVEGNMFTFLVPGFWVDLVTGGAFDLKPEVQFVPMTEVRTR